MAYAERLTKEDLKASGITDIDASGNVYRHGEKIELFINKEGYYTFNIYRFDDNGDICKKTLTREIKYTRKDGSIGKSIIKNTYIYNVRTVTVQRATYAWWNGEAPEGMVVDHWNDIKTDNNIFNLQLLTPSENLCKGTTKNTRMLKCKLNRPRKWYEDRLEKYIENYEKAKAEHNAKEAHKQRANIANMRAKLRYYDCYKRED